MNPEIRLFDYHTHVLEHGSGKPLRVEETIQAAIGCGLSAICLTDHYPLPSDFIDPTPDKDCAMPVSWYGDYQKQIAKMNIKYGDKINICRGAEFDWLPGCEDYIKAVQKRWSFDYRIGSIHFLGKNGNRNLILDYSEEEFNSAISFYRGIRPLVEKYYEAVRAMVNSGLFDGVGHVDLIKKYNDGSLFREDEPWYRDAVLETLDAVKKTGMVLEINTAGWDKKCQSVYPSLWILKEAYQRGIGLTLGSDGHTPDKIGSNLDRAVLLAKEAGYESLFKFEQRKKMEVSI